MKSFLLLLALFSLQLTWAQRTPKQYSIQQFYKTVGYGGGSFNKEESKLLIHDNSSKIFNVYELDIATGKKKPLTQSDKESFFAIDYVPGTDNFLYAADKGGNENSHIYLQTAGGSVKDLTPGEKEKASFEGWNKAKDAFYYSSNVRDPKFFDLYKLGIKDWKPELLFTNDKGYDVGTISPDERYLTLVKNITTDKNELYLFDRQKQEMTKLSKDGEEATYRPLAFEPNNSALYYGTNEGDEFGYIVKYDLAAGKRQSFFSAKWDVMGMDISENGKYHFIMVNEDARNKVLLYDHKTGKQLKFPQVKEGYVQALRFSPSEKAMVLYVAGDRSPMNLYHYSLQSGRLQQLTKALNPEIDPEDLVDATTVRFKSFDDLEIPAVYYKPQTASPKNKVPALVWVHGGPGGQSRAGYSQAIQYFVNHGYAVLAVNNRGSSGYGKTFYKMDNRNHGDKDLKDCVWGKKWLASQPDIDAGKIGIYGGSYGGFMSLAGIIQYPNEFAVGVDLFGVTNWLRTLKSIPPYWESFKAALYDEMGDPNTDSVRLRNISPLYNTDKIKTPLLVLQGSNDPRVLQVESDEIVAGAKRNGVPVEYVLFPDEGHGFVKKENQMKAAEVTLKFLDEHLRNAKSAPQKPAF
ncbi:MAG TPA: prolyl oligopeptidase family serine peptidase [Flavisolibacter sp.]|nr:prolyl oligopeptidase family serine peptidase [Flavisolibacter sp.]